jgi:streptogramin lyase
VVYHFLDRGDGAHPHALVRGPDGAMYGTTKTTVFRVAPSGALTTLFVFRRQEDGLAVSSPLTVGPGGFLYGTTREDDGGMARPSAWAPTAR